MGTKISALTEDTALADAHVIPLVDSGTTKKAQLSTLRQFMRDNENRWRAIDTSKYTALPPSTSTITMSDTGDFAVGLPVKYTISSVDYYGIVTAVSAGSSITIAGAALGSPTTISALYVGKPEMVTEMTLFVSGTYGNGTGDLLANDMKTYEAWDGADAYLVAFKGVQQAADSGASEPKINIKIGGNAVSTDDSNNGIQLGAAGTWVRNGAVAINTAQYKIERDDAIEVNCTAAGTNGDAENLTLRAQFVME
tara:strand:+ start:563 stop:1321 length:759 start_codon:yes stop_codon:yes gene_type:complete